MLLTTSKIFAMLFSKKHSRCAVKPELPVTHNEIVFTNGHVCTEMEISKVKSIAIRSCDTTNNESRDIYLFIQRRVYLLSSMIGDTRRPYNRIKGYVGLVVWFLNIIIHFSFDFYEASTVFHVSWASSIGLYLIMFISCTIFMIKYTVRWYDKLIKKLSQEEIYNVTFKQLHLMFKYLPYALATCSVAGASAQYGCYEYDGALKLSFDKTNNGTSFSPVPKSVEIILNVLRFTSLSHIYYMMFLMLLFNMVIFFTIIKTQNDFNAYLGKELKAHPPAITFQEAVDKFSVRTKLLRKASENTSAVLTILLLATSVSFVVNAYNFLFIKRYAIYVWFAIAPLIWNVTPLICGALVTSSYRELKLIVIQSWVEIPEEYDEIWYRTNVLKNAKNLPQPNWRAVLENLRRRKAKREEQEKSEQGLNVTSQMATEVEINEINNDNRNPLTKCVTATDGVNEHIKVTHAKVKVDTHEETSLSYTVYGSDARVNEQIRLKELEMLNNEQQNENNIGKYQKSSNGIKGILNRFRSFPKNDTREKNTIFQSSEKVEEHKKTVHHKLDKIVRIARAVDKFKSKRRRKFNYEKYIKFLELTLETIGFSVGKVNITWDRVSFFIVLLMSLVGVFAQNAFLK